MPGWCIDRLVFISVACLMVAFTITARLGSLSFSLAALAAVGKSFALSGVIFSSILHLRPRMPLTSGGAANGSTMGGEIGTPHLELTACASRRHRPLGPACSVGDPDVVDSACAPTARPPRDGSTPPGALHRGQLVLGNVVRVAATLQSVIDGFIASACSRRLPADSGVPQRGAGWPASAAPLFPVRGAKPP